MDRRSSSSPRRAPTAGSPMPATSSSSTRTGRACVSSIRPGQGRFIGMPVASLSPDGRQAAFGVETRSSSLISTAVRPAESQKGSGFVWAAEWSPTGDWITYTRFHGATSVVALVRPDGTDQKEISRIDEGDEANAAVWSPDGKYLLVSTRQRPELRRAEGTCGSWTSTGHGSARSPTNHRTTAPTAGRPLPGRRRTLTAIG